MTENNPREMESAVVKNLIIEAARVLGAMGTIVGIMWLFGSAYLTTFVTQIVDGKRLAPMAQVDALDSRVDRIEDNEREIEQNMARQGEKLENIQELLTEQRDDIKQLLRGSGRR